MVARLIATPAPMTVASDAPVTAVPSAVASASLSPMAERVRSPPAVTATPTGRNARTWAVTRLTAIAAATLMEPSLVSALGVFGVSAPRAPLAVALSSANSRCCATCPSTGSDAWSGPPAMLATARAFDSE
jgi:hypothetical protein